MLTVQQVADILKKSPRRIRQMIKEGKLKAIEQKKVRIYYLIEESELERLKEKQK